MTTMMLLLIIFNDNVMCWDSAQQVTMLFFNHSNVLLFLDIFSGPYEYFKDRTNIRAIVGVYGGSTLSFIIMITLLIVACVCVGCRYVKRKVRAYGVTNQDVIANETGNIVSSDSLQPPATLPNAVNYSQLAKDIKTTTSDAVSESLPELSPSKPPPVYAANNALTVTPTQDVVH